MRKSKYHFIISLIIVATAFVWQNLYSQNLESKEVYNHKTDSNGVN